MIINGDAFDVMTALFDDETFQCCVTSPPYWGLRDYGVSGQLGLENTPEEYVAKLVRVFREVKRVLKEDGTLWLNLGDSYSQSGRGGHSKNITGRGKDECAFNRQRVPNGLKPKDLVGIPWRTAFALQADGWYLRQDIIWAKPNPMPESVTDRCTKSHEYIFLLSKSHRYYFDHEAIQEPAVCGARGSEFHTGKTGEHQLGRSQKIRPSKVKGEFKGKGPSLPGKEPFRAVRDVRNKRSVWTITTKPFKGAHFATFPPDLIEPCILAGCPKEGLVLDPFFGAGTTGLSAKKLDRKYVGVELNPEYCQIAEKRLRDKP